jgi:hypothetical protein
MGEDAVQLLLEKDRLVLILLAFSIVTIVALNVIGGVIKSVARERTRREVAAFIAEGSMTPEQGERLLRAGKDAKVDH